MKKLLLAALALGLLSTTANAAWNEWNARLNPGSPE
jgi:hypothetical protein